MTREDTLAAVVAKLKRLRLSDLNIILAIVSEWDSWRATFETLADEDLMAQLGDRDGTVVPAEKVAAVLDDEARLRELLTTAAK
jgi:hypothetical protein